MHGWVPDDDQWWITGFNTEYRDPVSADMAMIGSADFSRYELIYEQVKNGFLAENNDECMMQLRIEILRKILKGI